jgi:DNA-binding winged helix-turn-helix (wHTH) protein/Tfp pilus assembly protein PilF
MHLTSLLPEAMVMDMELHFDGWTVNRVSGEIARNGRVSRLQQQPLRILLELADHAGAIVTREQLVKVVWPAGIVDFDNGLNVAVRKLRVALDDVGDVTRYIETLPRVGYRFIAIPGREVQEPSSTEAAASMPRSRVALVLSVAALAVAITVGAWWTMRNARDPQPAAAPSAARAKHVPSPRALELYLEGIHDRSRRDINAANLALEEFAAALKEDPDYPDAWAAFGATYNAMVMRQMRPPAEALPKARAAIQRALALDPNLAEAHAVLAQIYLDQDRNFSAADQELKRALALNDHSARVWLNIAMWHAQLGHVDESLAAVRHARALEPMTLLPAGDYALILYNARRYDEAIAFLKPLMEANPHFDYARSVLVRALMATGDFAGAQEQIKLIEDPGLNRSDVGLLDAKLGRRGDALREIDKLESHARKGFGVGYDEAIIYMALGQLDRACEALARAVDDRSLMLSWMRLDPRVDALRDKQCYMDVEKRVYGTN